MIILQILFFVFTELLFLFLSMTKLDIVTKRYSDALAYLGLCLALFFNAKVIMMIVQSGHSVELFNRRLSDILFVISINILLQLAILIIIKNIFIKILIPAFVNIFSCLFLFYFVGFGIINVVWSVIFTGFSCGLMLLIYLFNDLYLLADLATKSKIEKTKLKMCKDIKSDLDKYLKLGVQAFFAIAASIGVSMTILFKDGIKAWENQDFLFNAVLMVTGMVFLSLGLLIWVGKPYLDLNGIITKIKTEALLNNDKCKSVHITSGTRRQRFRSQHL